MLQTATHTKSFAARSRSSGRQAVCRGGGRKHSDLVVHRSELEDQVHGTGLRHFSRAPAPSLRVSGLLFFDPPLLSHSRTRPPFLIPSYHHSSAFLCKHLAVTPRALVILKSFFVKVHIIYLKKLYQLNKFKSIEVRSKL